ncbi:MAG: hypothetical protein KME14_20270 [Tildeniella torsiva UHER 1998/13D]|jgi:hypothetical protein|nr:hypothetical protein [Tildeniella torsiva UHER 1998/13D]
MARLTTTGSNRTADAVSTNGISARQRSLIATAQATAAATQAQAEAEKKARDQPITGTATGYDPVTGDWLVSTPDGGTVRAQSLTNGALVGKRLPVQRFADSQTSAVNAPPTDADQGWVVGELEALQRDVVALGAVQLQPRDPDGVADARYDGDKWLNTETNDLSIWVQETEDWRAVSGGAQIIYGEGDPNLTEVPWVPNAFYHNTLIGRMYVASPVEDGKWLPTGTMTFDSDSYPDAGAFYPGDLYQGDDGAFFRLKRNGLWIVQWFCPDCEEEPEEGPPGLCSLGSYPNDEGYPPGTPLWYVACS